MRRRGADAVSCDTAWSRYSIPTLNFGKRPFHPCTPPPAPCQSKRPFAIHDFGLTIGNGRFTHAPAPLHLVKANDRFLDPTGHLSQDEIEEFFGYDSRQAMLDDGWLEDLVNWLGYPDVTWHRATDNVTI